jgi:hypothetical protein
MLTNNLLAGFVYVGEHLGDLDLVPCPDHKTHNDHALLFIDKGFLWPRELPPRPWRGFTKPIKNISSAKTGK